MLTNRYVLLPWAQAIDVPVFEMGTEANPVDIAKAGIAEAKKRKVDAVIVDTAGRLQVGQQPCRCHVV